MRRRTKRKPLNLNLTLSLASLIVAVVSLLVGFEPLATIKADWPRGLLTCTLKSLPYLGGGGMLFFLGMYLGGRRRARPRSAFGSAGSDDQAAGEFKLIAQTLLPLLDTNLDFSFYQVFRGIGNGKNWLGQPLEAVSTLWDDFFILTERMRESNDWKQLAEHLNMLVQRLERICAQVGRHRADWRDDWADTEVIKLTEKYEYFANTMDAFCRRMQWRGLSIHSMKAILRV